MAGNRPRPGGRQSIACRVADPLWMSTVSGPPDVWPQALATVSIRTSGARNAHSFVICTHQIGLDGCDRRCRKGPSISEGETAGGFSGQVLVSRSRTSVLAGRKYGANRNARLWTYFVGNSEFTDPSSRSTHNRQTAFPCAAVLETWFGLKNQLTPIVSHTAAKLIRDDLIVLTPLKSNIDRDH